MKMKLKTMLLLTILSLGICSALPMAAQSYTGFKQYTDTYSVQHPYDLPESARFSVTSGPVYNCWIFANDKGFSSTTTTGPRTEMRWATNWTGKAHMWEADVMIDSGSEGSAIMQVKSNDGFEPIYVQVRANGSLYNDNGATVLATNMWGKWFHMVVSYDPASGNGNVWINGKLVVTRHDPHPITTVWYFKNGVYGITGSKSETHYKNFKFWAK